MTLKKNKYLCVKYLHFKSDSFCTLLHIFIVTKKHERFYLSNRYGKLQPSIPTARNSPLINETFQG